MTRLKDQIRLAKQALKIADKRPDLYTEEELQYMQMQQGCEETTERKTTS